MTKENTETIRCLLIIAATSLLIAVIPIWPYGFYTLLRILTCSVTAYSACLIHKNHSELRKHEAFLILIAIIFNPIIPVYLIRVVWIPIDAAVGVYLLILWKRIGRA